MDSSLSIHQVTSVQVSGEERLDYVSGGNPAYCIKRDILIFTADGSKLEITCFMDVK